MPNYDYKCKICLKNFEIFHYINESFNKECPNCKKNELEKEISNSAGIFFKGSGFYETDYKKNIKKTT